MKKKIKNQPKIKRRKNFLPTLMLALFAWASWGWLVYSMAPENNLLLFIFYGLLFMAVFLTIALLLANSRRGLLIAIGVISFLIFRYYQLANFLNLGLFFGILLSLELYFRE
jgi:hypothetical protein